MKFLLTFKSIKKCRSWLGVTKKYCKLNVYNFCAQDDSKLKTKQKMKKGQVWRLFCCCKLYGRVRGARGIEGAGEAIQAERIEIARGAKGRKGAVV